MTYPCLLDSLKAAAGGAAYDRAAPAGATRFVVGHTYGANSHRGDDRNLLNLPRVQLDVYAQTPDDSLFPAVCDLLDALDLPYDVQDEIYDDDLALFRWILQTEVTG